MHFKHITAYHSKYINGYFHAHILKLNSFLYSVTKTWTPTYSLLVYSILPSREGHTLPIPTAKSRGETHGGQRKNFKTSNLSLDLLRILQLHQDFTTPWKHACVTAQILHCKKRCIVTSSPNWNQQPLAQHTQVLYSCSWWISCLLAWFPLVLTQHNTVNFSGWLENIPLKYVSKHELRALCWRLSYKCNISAVGQYSSAIFFLLTAAWILTVSCNHIEHLSAIFFFSRKHDSFLLEGARLYHP